jgi:tetratricopeptide (TPR) repeat protein
VIGQHEKAIEEDQEALRRDSKSAGAYFNMSVAFCGLNRLEEAKAMIGQGIAQKLDADVYHALLYRIALLQGDGATMQQQIDRAVGKSGEIGSLVQQANTAAYRGQLRKGNELYSHAIELARSRSLTENAALIMLTKAKAEGLLGSDRQAKEDVAEALAVARTRTTLTSASTILAQCGETAQAQALIEELSSRFPKHTLLKAIWLPMARALIEINHNNPVEAIQFLQPAAQYELGVNAGLAPSYVRGFAYLRQQSGAEAISEFQKILDHRSNVVPISPVYPLAQLGLGRAAALIGDTGKARKAYQDFFTLWKDADPDIPILIEAKREYETLR